MLQAYSVYFRYQHVMHKRSLCGRTFSLPRKIREAKQRLHKLQVWVGRYVEKKIEMHAIEMVHQSLVDVLAK
jgi:hypothetical protein